MSSCSNPSKPAQNQYLPSMETRLERGELILLNPCPFPLPSGDDLTFLMQQRLNGTVHKNISYNPETHTLAGFVHESQEQARRLENLLQQFSARACGWLAEQLPRYVSSWHPDRASLRTEEEATRKLRLTARNDLLHFDAFPSRPTRGHRILRLYVNINPSDERVWITSDSFAKVLEKYGAQVGLPSQQSSTWVKQLGKGLLNLFQVNSLERTEYDEFMLRLHHFLKTNQEFQECSPRRLWHFKPGVAWLFFADSICHAELRGQHALEHSFFIAPSSLVCPEESPLEHLQRRCGTSFLSQVA